MTQTLSRKLQFLKSTITFDTYVCIQKYQFIMETNICNCTFLLKHSLPTGNTNLPFLDFFNPFPYHDEKEGNADMPLEKFISYCMEYGLVTWFTCALTWKRELNFVCA